ncbi:hypothetical protein SLE2022_396760 [Rubroshorea leprosula]
MTDNLTDQEAEAEAAATLLAFNLTDQEAEAAATLLAMPAEGSPAVNIRRFPILPEAREPDNLSSVRLAGRAAVNESRRVPYNLQELISRCGWGARRPRSAIARKLPEWGTKKARSGPVIANKSADVGSPAVNIRRFPILPECGARRPRSAIARKLPEWGTKKARSGPVIANKSADVSCCLV